MVRKLPEEPQRFDFVILHQAADLESLKPEFGSVSAYIPEEQPLSSALQVATITGVRS
jgi:hypothetical protein